ncbi:hypothetical protein B0H19DRAFT_1158985 [Mycena capillaripes]|nr:hypothetical protein B0H19DRAFT_1204200 [Mycena capillaripes]KAJ6551805.1 hypothetical protein B0H19DRAFT_1158985 [Mycena capillaripes]
MSSVHSARGALDSDDEEDDVQIQSRLPTVELDLGALEHEFDKQLGEVMDNLFGDEFASLNDLESIATSSPSVGSKDANGKSDNMSTSAVQPGSLTATEHSRNSKWPATDVYTSAKTGSISLADDGVIVRSTRMPASTIAQFSNGSGEPALGSTSSARGETITRSTNMAQPPSTSKEPTAPWGSLRQPTVFPSQETVIRSTNSPGVQSGYRPVHVETTPLRGQSVQSPSLSFPPYKTPQSANPALPKPSFVSLLQTNFSQIPHNSSHPTSGLSTSEMFQNPPTEHVNEDIEMSDLRSPPEMVRGAPAGPFQTGWNQSGEIGRLQTPFFWAHSVNQETSSTALSSSITSSYVDYAPLASTSTSSYSVPEPWTIFPSHFASNSNSSHSELASPALYCPHPSIFELIQDESPLRISAPLLNPYIIPPAFVPHHVWQKEFTRSRLHNSENRAKSSKRRKVSSPYFFRTPLVLVKSAHRGRKTGANRFSSSSHTAGVSEGPILKHDDSRSGPPRMPQGRASSPTFSCSSEGSSISGASLTSSESTFRSYDRRLSSPPPFRQRQQRFRAPTNEGRGFLSALMSMSWLWSRQA